MDFLRKPTPYKDESLLSYLYRFSDANAILLEWPLNKLSIKTSIKNINFLNDYKHIEKIANVTSKDIEQIKNMTFNKYNSHHIFYKKQDRYIYKIDEYYYNTCRKNDPFYNEYMMLFHEVKFCPDCLKEDRYHRLHWSFYQTKICIKHKKILQKNCGYCGKEVDIRDIVNGTCSCNNDLAENNSISCEDECIYNTQVVILKNL